MRTAARRTAPIDLKERRYAVAVRRHRRMSQEDRDEVIERAYAKNDSERAYFETVAMDVDAEEVVNANDSEDARWNGLTPAEQAAEEAAFEEWEARGEPEDE
jgi:hypothetical protein